MSTRNVSKRIERKKKEYERRNFERKKKFDLCIMSYLIPVVIVGETKYLKKKGTK